MHRLLLKPPVVHIGPNASRSLTGERGLLLGARRPEWVDVFEFEPRPSASWRELVAARFDESYSWDVVGLSLSGAEMLRLESKLVGELVPGDVVMTETGPSVNMGDAWSPTTRVGKL